MIRKIKTYWLGGALVLYALFSSSTPDQIGIAEIGILAFLILFVGIKGIIEPAGGFFFKRKKEIPNYVYIIFQLLFYIPTVYGLIANHNEPGNYIRDIVPFVYLFLPLFFMPVMREEPLYWLRLIVYLISLVGVSYSIRFFLIDPQSVFLIGRQIIFGDLNYFPMDPAVIFTATFLLIMGMNKLSTGSVMSGALHLLGGLIAYASILGILVRAQIALVLLAILANLFLLFGRRMLLPFIILMVIMAVVGYYAGDFFIAVLDLMMQKFARVGLSARDLEMMAVVNNALSDLPTFIFGEGWGGLISNPTTGYASVRYVHNFFMYSLFKAGVIGMFLIVTYIFWLFMLFYKSFAPFKSPSHFTLASYFAIFNAVIVHVVFEAGYKMFSFGLILCILILSHQVMKSEKKKESLGPG